MASIIYRLAFSFVIIVIGLTGFGSTRMVTYIRSYNDITEEVEIECSADGYSKFERYPELDGDTGFDVNKKTRVIRIEVRSIKNGIIAQKDLGHNLKKLEGMRGNMEVHGSIKGDGSSGIVTVKINNPGVKNAGEYVCDVYDSDYFKTHNPAFQGNTNITLQASRVHVITEYRNNDEEIGKLLNVTCVVDRTDWWVINSIEITKEGQEEPIAIIDEKQEAQGPIKNTNTEVKGFIYNGVDMSFLTIIVSQPRSGRDTGVYKCRVSVTDEYKQERIETVSTSVLLEYQEFADMMHDLKSVMSTLMTIVRDFGWKQKKTLRKFRKNRNDINNLMRVVKQHKILIQENQQQKNIEEATTTTTTMTNASMTASSTIIPESTTTSKPTTATTTPKSTTTSTATTATTTTKTTTTSTAITATTTPKTTTASTTTTTTTTAH